MKVARNIKKLRKKKGWTQSDLAKAIECHLSHITRIETGKYSPSLEVATKMAKALEIPLDDLVHGDSTFLKEVKIEDQSFAKKIDLLNTLDEKEKMVIISVIDAMLTKKKMFQLLIEEEGKV